MKVLSLIWILVFVSLSANAQGQRGREAIPKEIYVNADEIEIHFGDTYSTKVTYVNANKIEIHFDRTYSKRYGAVVDKKTDQAIAAVPLDPDFVSIHTLIDLQKRALAEEKKLKLTRIKSSINEPMYADPYRKRLIYEYDLTISSRDRYPIEERLEILKTENKKLKEGLDQSKEKQESLQAQLGELAKKLDSLQTQLDQALANQTNKNASVKQDDVKKEDAQSGAESHVTQAEAFVGSAARETRQP